MKNALVAQSGGPTAAINATLAGVIGQCMASTDSIGMIYGALNGIEGLLEERILNLGGQIRGGEDLALLAATPAMALGSCRHRLPSVEQDIGVYRKIHAIFQKYDIGYFFYIGGNDSMDTAQKLSAYFAGVGADIRVIGLPKTIDNDLPVTDHTPGYGSAARYVAGTMVELLRDCSIYNLPSVTIVEMMGRHVGWLTAAAAVPRQFGLPAPQLVYLPEVPFAVERFLGDVRACLAEQKCVLVAISEGLRTAEGVFVCDLEASAATDAFGHRQLSGAGKALEHIVRREIGCKVRSVELNILQRCAGQVASACDREESEQVGRDAVRAALAGHTGKLVYLRRLSDEPYQSETGLCALEQVANHEKAFPSAWINPEGNGVTAEAMGYILPLIRGAAPGPVGEYIPRHFEFDRSALANPID